MRIALIQNVTLNDHRSVHTHNVACELSRRGHDVDVILQKTDEVLQFGTRPYNLIQVPGETYSVKGQIKFMKASYTVVRKGNYDIIHAKNPFSSVLVPIFLKKMKLIESKIIYDMRGLWVDFGVHAQQFSRIFGTALNAVDILFMRLSDDVISISAELKRILVMRGIPRDKITVITGSGVDIAEIERTPLESLKDVLGITGILIGYVGTVSVSRQSDKLIEAFQNIHQHCKDCHLVLLGPEDGNIREKIKEVDNVTLVGFVPHGRAISLMKSFDISVAYHDCDDPIFTVAVPIKVLEYMAAGVPVVASDHLMYRNILTHKETGFLTDSQPEQFAQGVLTVLDDESLRKSMVIQARKEVEKYSIETLVDQLESIYRR